MENLTNPAVLARPFCDTGDKNTIPVNATGTQNASLAEGFPPVTQKPIGENGIPPERKDFNGIANLNSQFYFAFQNGWLPTFNADVSTAIGGYPLGAVLWHVSQAGTVSPVRSLIANNTYNFNTNAEYIGVYWAEVGIDSRANIDLSNLSQTGESHFDTTYVKLKSGVTQTEVDYVVATQLPTSENNYRWVREYKSGWVEQGGIVDRSQTDTVNLSVTMADNYYSIIMFSRSGHVYAYQNTASTTTYFKFNSADDNTDNNTGIFYWEVKGYKAN